MANDPTEHILGQYDDSVDLYEGLTRKLKNLIEEMLQDANVKLHSVTCRCKTKESLRGKLTRPDKGYYELSDVTDIAGIRIVTYFENDLDKVAQLLEGQFKVDWENSKDRRTVLDPDRFGYLSVHHILELNQDRVDLMEYRRFGGLKAEVQTRSILQHAWAEIEHDLGYKNTQSVPREAQRTFSRLAGLLETADLEFSRLREELDKYVREIPERIESVPQDVEINKDSMMAFMEHNALMKEIDQEVANALPEAYLVDRTPGHKVVAVFVERLKAVGISTVQDLEIALQDHRSLIPPFAREWLNEVEPQSSNSLGYTLGRGVSVVYLAYLVAAETLNARTIGEKVAGRRSSPLFEERARIAEARITRVYDAVRTSGSA